MSAPNLRCEDCGELMRHVLVVPFFGPMVQPWCVDPKTKGVRRVGEGFDPDRELCEDCEEELILACLGYEALVQICNNMEVSEQEQVGGGT